MNDENSNRKLPISEKLEYSFTDGAGNLLYCTITAYILLMCSVFQLQELV